MEKEESDLTIQVYGEAYMHERSILRGIEEVCLEEDGDEKVLEIGDKTVKIEVEK